MREIWDKELAPVVKWALIVGLLFVAWKYMPPEFIAWAKALAHWVAELYEEITK